MKNKKYFSIFALSLMVVFSIANLTYAQTIPSYVGIKKGEKYTWTLAPNIQNINQTGILLLGEENYTYGYNLLSELLKNETGLSLPDLALSSLSMEILNISQEQNFSVWKGVKVNTSLSYVNPTNGSVVNVSYPEIYILDPLTINQSTNIVLVETTFMGGFLLMPTGLNMTLLAYAYYKYINMTVSGSSGLGIGTNVTIVPQAYGLRAQVKGDFLYYVLNSSISGFNNITEQLGIDTFKDVTVDIQWDSTTGVLKFISVSYDGLQMISIQTSQSNISSFEIPSIIAITIITLFGIVIYTRRKIS